MLIRHARRIHFKIRIDSIFPGSRREGVQGHLDADLAVTIRGQDEIRRAVDLTVVHTVTSSHTYSHRGAAAEMAERRKHDHYHQSYNLTSLDVVPVAIETYGFMGVEGVNFIKDVVRASFGRVQAVEGQAPPPWRTNSSYSHRLRAVFTYLSVALARANADVYHLYLQQCIGQPVGVPAG